MPAKTTRATKKLPARKVVVKPTGKRSASPKPATKTRATKRRGIKSSQVQDSAAFADAQTKAERYAKNPKKLGKLFEEAVEKASAIPKGTFGEAWTYLQAMLRLIQAYAKGEYREISWQSLMVVVVAVVYFVSPIDLVPDWIPVVGLVDDAVVVSWAMKQVKEELDTFTAWEVSSRRKRKTRAGAVRRPARSKS